MKQKMELNFKKKWTNEKKSKGTNLNAFSLLPWGAAAAGRGDGGQPPGDLIPPAAKHALPNRFGRFPERKFDRK